MFLTSSCLIYERLYLITLGASCRYAIVAADGALIITDPGASAHVAALEQRLSRLKLSLTTLSRVLITHLDADRVAGIPLLRRANPLLKVYGTSAMHSALSDRALIQSLFERDQEISRLLNSPSPTPPLSIEEFRSGLRIDKVLAENDSVEIDEDLSVRSVATPGHRNHSVSYLVVPHEFAIVDETFGYFRGRNLVAPGGDRDIKEALNSVQKFNDIELSGIGFSYGGAITGALTKRHITALIQNTEDLRAEVNKARRSGFTEEEIARQVEEGFYSTQLNDPCLTASLKETFHAVMKQLS